MNNPDALNAVMNIEGFRALGNDIFETVVNKSDAVKKAKKEKGEEITPAEKKELTAEEKEYKSKRKQIQEKLVKFATRIPAFMYLTDFARTPPGRHHQARTGPVPHRHWTTVEDFHLLVTSASSTPPTRTRPSSPSGATRTRPCPNRHRVPQGARHYGLYDLSCRR